MLMPTGTCALKDAYSGAGGGLVDVDELKSALEQAVEGLADIGWKRMFGCDAGFRDGNIFALVWKEGRLGLKFPQEQEFEARIGVSGSDRWAPGGRQTKHWVLLPESVAADAAELRAWAEVAHASSIQG